MLDVKLHEDRRISANLSVAQSVPLRPSAVLGMRSDRHRVSILHQLYITKNISLVPHSDNDKTDRYRAQSTAVHPLSIQ